LFEGFCSLNVILRLGDCQNEGDELREVFPNYNNEDHVRLVKDAVAILLETTRKEIDVVGKHDDVLYSLIFQKLTEWMRILTNDLGGETRDLNTSLLARREFWMMFDFLCITHKTLNIKRPFVHFRSVNDFYEFDLFSHPFNENASLEEIPSESISCQGLKVFLSQPTPVTLFNGDHFFLAETKGACIFVIFQS
jgi:hypothetical protein